MYFSVMPDLPMPKRLRAGRLDPASSPAFGGIEITGFRLEFTPLQNGAGMTILIEGGIYKQTLFRKG
jgi:hypothetical protein